jgi:hypothetical protein
MAHAYICDFARSSIGRYGGALKDVLALSRLAILSECPARASP